MSVDTTVTIRERCGCGATLVYRGDQPNAAGNLFRRNHRHEPPDRDVGPCAAELPSLLGLPSATAERIVRMEARPTCSLDYGHSGAHLNDETDATWLSRDEATS